MNQKQRNKKITFSVVWASVMMLGLISFYNSCSEVAFDVYKDEEIHKSRTSTIMINKNATYTNSTQVSLILDGLKDGEMFISNNPECKIGYWEPYQSTKEWELKQTNGRAHVYAKYKIEKMEVFSGCVTDAIIHDDVTPALQFNSIQKVHSNLAKHSINYVAMDSMSGVKTVHCGYKIDDVTEVCKINGDTSIQHSEEGFYNYLFRVEDHANNQSELFIYEWVYDKTAPIIHNLQASMSEITSQKNALFKFEATDNLTKQNELKFECMLLGEYTWTECHTPVYFTESNLQSKAQHTFSIRVTDKARNTSAVSSYTWKIKPGTIDIQITSAPSTYIKNPIAQFAFSAIEDGQRLPNSAENFTCQLNTTDVAGSIVAIGAVEPCTSMKAYALKTEGKYQFVVKAKNYEGVYSQPAVRYFTFDNSIGEFLVTGPKELTNELTAIFTITPKQAEDDIAKYECSINGSAYSELGCGPQVIYTEQTVVENQENTFTARITDNAGNISETTTYKWNVDKQGPEVKWVANTLPPAETNQISGNIKFVSTDDHSPADEIVSTCRLVKELTLIVEHECQQEFKINNLIEGSYTLTVISKDALGNASLPITHTWAVNTTLPELAFIKHPGKDEAIYNTQKGVIHFQAKNYTELSCKLDDNSFTENCVSAQDIVLAELSKGEHTFTVTLENKFGVSQDFTITWEVNAVGECNGLPYEKCLVLHDDFERVDILAQSETIGWSKILDDKTRADKVDVCIFPNDFCNSADNTVGDGHQIGVAGNGEKAAYFVGRVGGSVHSMYLFTKVFDLSEYNKMNLSLKYLLISMEAYAYLDYEGLEHFKVEICNSTPEACGVVGDHRQLNDDAVWTTLKEHYGSWEDPINKQLNGSNHARNDWTVLDIKDIDLNTVTTNKNQVSLRINVKLDEGFYVPERHSEIEVPLGTTQYQLIDGVGIDDIKVIAVK